MMNRPILIVTHESLSNQMAGPAIRVWNLALQISKVRPVILAADGVNNISSDVFTIVSYDRNTGEPLKELVTDSAAVLLSGFLLDRYAHIFQDSVPIIVDLYGPFWLENLQLFMNKPVEQQWFQNDFSLTAQKNLLKRGDFFICASEKQRDLWLGMLASEGRVNPATISNDPTLGKLIDIVPFGIPSNPPLADIGAIKGKFPGIALDDKVIYWSGGLWDWMDPLTAIRAVAQVAKKRSDVKLFFAGTKHPTADVPPMEACKRAMSLSDSIGLTNNTVFFNDWVDYSERVLFLADADVGISLHYANLETRYSFRTRLLDYIWAGIPMVVTKGDVIGEWISNHGIGITTNPSDVDGVANALIDVLDRVASSDFNSSGFDLLRTKLSWDSVVTPLLAFVETPTRSADAKRIVTSPHIPSGVNKIMQLLGRGRRASAIRDLIGYFISRLTTDQ